MENLRHAAVKKNKESLDCQPRKFSKPIFPRHLVSYFNLWKEIVNEENLLSIVLNQTIK